MGEEARKTLEKFVQKGLSPMPDGIPLTIAQGAAYEVLIENRLLHEQLKEKTP